MPKIQNPFTQLYHRPAWSGFFHPTSIGTVTAFTLVVSSKTRVALPWVTLPRELTNLLSMRGSAALIGFILGFGITSGFDWARWRIVQLLLSYQGWLYDQKSIKTKLWALALRIAQGPGPKSTYHYEDLLPRQPLPSLDQTLDRYLDVASSLVSPQELILTKQAIEDFRNNEGPKLQAHLQNKKATTRSWLADYWLHTTYLGSRESLPVYSNYYTAFNVTKFGASDAIVVAAGHIHRYAQFQSIIEKEQLSPLTLRGFVPISMYGYKTLFNCTRIPDLYMDKLACYPDSTHVAVSRNGHYFKLDMYALDEETQAKTLLSPEEIKMQLERILEEAADLEAPSQKVATLTAQKRNVWAEVREKLMSQSGSELEILESAIFHVSLEIDTEFKNTTEQGHVTLVGDGSNRWFDKCFTVSFYKDGNIGMHVEHSFTDATYLSSIVEFSLSQLPEYRNGDVIKNKPHPPRQLQPPQRVAWKLEGMDDDLLAAEKRFLDIATDVDTYSFHGQFGKAVIKQLRVSPDSFFQMIVQLAYYRMHGEIVKTYQPATGRMFALGRTETIHTVSQHSIAFVRSIDDETVPRADVINHFKAAIRYHTQFKFDATQGYGCDRHLLGLYCAAREMGMDVPQLYRDKVFQMPWILATSQTPTLLQDIGVDLDYHTLTGGFGPLHTDGYGISYGVLEDSVNCFITCWKSSEHTSATKFAEELDRGMIEMASLLGYTQEF